MDNSTALIVFEEIVANARKTTEEHPPGFWGTFVGFGTDLNRSSRHIDNNGMRKAYFHIGTLESPLREALNHDLRNQVYNYVKCNELDVGPGVHEIILDASTWVTIYCISEADGRDIIDMERLRDDLGEATETLGEEATTVTVFNISEAIREIYEPFVSHWSSEVVNLYQDIESNCSDWEDVMRVISEKTTELDNRAIKWKRADT